MLDSAVQHANLLRSRTWHHQFVKHAASVGAAYLAIHILLARCVNYKDLEPIPRSCFSKWRPSMAQSSTARRFSHQQKT